MPRLRRRIPLTVLSAGVLLAELVGSDLSSCRAQNLRRPGADRAYEIGPGSGAVGSTGVRGGARATAQLDARPEEAGACTSQQAFLLKKYTVRPAWKVAGVDYCVGYDTDIVLKSPLTISMTGVSVDGTHHVVTVTGNNVTLDGYDFSLDGGWQVSVQAPDARIVNSGFVIGSNDLIPIVGTTAASNLVVAHCSIDGAGHNPGPWGTLFGYRGGGFTIEYSVLENSGGDMIQQIDGGAGSTIVVRNNLIQNGGMSPGAHGDYTQLAGGPFTVSINYNTTVQNGGSTQGLMTEYVAEGEIGHNTMVGTVSYFVSVDLSSITTSFTVHDNYFDPQGYGFAYPSSKTGLPNDSSPKSVFTNNVNMRTGALVQDSARR